MDFQTLKANLGDWLGKDTTALPDATRGLIINMAIREYLRTLDLRFGEKIDLLAAVANQVYTVLPADFSRPYSTWYYDSGKCDVVYLTKEEFDIKYPDYTVTGDPKHYTIWGGKVYWGPTPSANRNINFIYYGYLPDLVAPTDHNDFTDLAWEVLHFKALSLCSLYGIEDGRVGTWESFAAKQENKLVMEHSRKSAGRRPTSREYGYTGA